MVEWTVYRDAGDEEGVGLSLGTSTSNSAAALHCADQGHALPSEALTETCGADPAPFVAHRNKIATTLAADKRGRTEGGPEDPRRGRTGLTAVNDTAEFIDALKRLREWSGLTFRDLPRATAARIHGRCRLPRCHRRWSACTICSEASMTIV